MSCVHLLMCKPGGRLFAVFSVAALAACTTLSGLGPGFRVACGFADVLVKEADLTAVDQAFAGPNDTGTKMCRAVRAYFQTEPGSAEEPIIISEPMIAELELPSGERIGVRLEPSSSRLN